MHKGIFLIIIHRLKTKHKCIKPMILYYTICSTNIFITVNLNFNVKYTNLLLVYIFIFNFYMLPLYL